MGAGREAGASCVRGVRSKAAAVAVVLALICGGSLACGGGESDEEAIRTVVADVQEAFGAGDMREVCRSLTRAGRRHVEGMGHDEPDADFRPPCHEDLREFFYLGIWGASKNWPEDAGRDIRDIRVDGDRATATVEFGRGATGMLPLAKEDGDWRLDALFGGTPGAEQEDHY